MSKKPRKLKFFLTTTLVIASVVSFDFLQDLFKPKPVDAAERIVFKVPNFTDLYMSVDSLEVFAKEGIISNYFAFYAAFMEEEDLANLQKVLQKRFDIPPELISRLTNMAMGEDFLKYFGQLVQINPDINGYDAIRTALIEAASDPEEGFTIINVIKKFPAETIRISTNFLSEFSNELTTFNEYRDTSVTAIIEQTEKQVATDPKIDYSQLADLSKPGPYKVIKKSISFEISGLRQTYTGLAGSYNLEADIYLPAGISQPVPLVVYSHGFGAEKKSILLAEHLASYGIALAGVEHLGSDLAYRQSFLKGEVDIDISPIEYLSRPLDLSYLLDELEKLVETDPDWKSKLDLNKVGALGNSFGATTVLSLGGANINLPRLNQECDPENLSLNISVLLQCRANYLPPSNYQLRDPRIKAVFAYFPLTSVVFGPEEMRNISVPTLMMGGSHDLLTPGIEEDVHPFIWMDNPDKYLAFLIPGTHFSTSTLIPGLPEILQGPTPEVGQYYLKNLSVAFFKKYLDNQSEYEPYLTASYGKVMNKDSLSLNLIQSLKAQQLETAYGNSPPKPIVPPTVTAQVPKRQESILEEIQRTGVMKVAIRRDATPFGYVNNTGEWAGYCEDIIDVFAQKIAQELKISTGVKVIKIPSNLENRFQLVQNGNVHLECGPNTIRDDVINVAFSNPFFVTGTNFLVAKDTEINPNSNLAGVKTGVLRNTTTEKFIQTKYPETEAIYFEGNTGVNQAVKSLAKGEIQAFVNDGILSIGEVVRQNLDINNYKLIPEKPLTCDFYGMIIPNNDPEWQNKLNSFIDGDKSQPIDEKWFKKLFPYQLENLDYCVNHKK
ncbi:alpha/beta hydrolase [Okeania sp. SIO1F9]|uniref:alpha/beta hydrolase n=1 Tax=Okeania sp. SIO1F9 TaxID=2607813 RepID=UPI00144EDCB1|nr:alpha/beta hydrolase [Okeania sp. SIO1F9]NET77744.1 alpha/beta hydrolase [Okeania sp. SIO1F9]